MSSVFRAVVAVAAMATSVPAVAETSWYVSGDAGAYFRQPSTGTVVVLVYDVLSPCCLEPARLDRSLDFNPGFTGHLAFGAHVLKHVRVEGELGYTGYSSDQFRVTNLPPDTGINGLIQRGGGSYLYRRISEAGNVFYDFSPVLGVTPYFGGGLGIQEYHSRTNSYGNGGAGDIVVEGGSGVVGFGQLEAGLTFRLSRRLSLSPAYRYVRTFGPQSNPTVPDLTRPGLAPNNGDRSGDVAHVAKVGLRYDF